MNLGFLTKRFRKTSFNTDLLLIMCPPWDTTRPPINLAYLKSFMESHGYRVDVLDLNIKFFNELKKQQTRDLWEMMSQNSVGPDQMTHMIIEETGSLIDRYAQELTDADPRYFGFSLHYRNVLFTELLVQRIRDNSSSAPIIYGGSEIAARQRLGTLHDLSADLFVVGEGELSLLDSLRNHEKSGRFRPAPGVIVQKRRGARRRLSTYGPRPLITNLDELPFPDFKAFDLAEYHQEEDNPNLPFLFSRGCIGKCSFCMDHYMTGRHRVRSPENAVAEIKRHIEDFGITRFSFNDLICNGNPRKLFELCDEIIREGLKIRWWSYAVIRKGLSRELFEHMREAGCVGLNFGLESASDNVLKLMNKYYDSSVAETTLRNCATAGLNTSINIIVGFPGETLENHRETMAFIRRNREFLRTVVNLGTLMLTPGTRIATRPEEYGLKIDPVLGSWYTDDGNCLAERNRRLDEVKSLLAELGIPLVIVNRELAPGAAIQDSCPENKPSIRIRDAVFLNDRNQPAESFSMGSKGTLVIRYDVRLPVENPLFRVQLFCDENPAQHDVFVFGTNTSRFNMNLGRLSPGSQEIQLVFNEYRLPPGTYKVTVGVSATEESPEPLDIHHGRYRLQIDEPLDCGSATAMDSCSWSLSSNPTCPARNIDSLDRLSLRSTDGLASSTFSTHQEMVVTARCRSSSNGASLVAEIRQSWGVVHRSTSPFDVPAGEHVVNLAYSPLSLLNGDYEIRLALVDEQGRECLSEVRAPISVNSQRPDGAGLYFQPVVWNQTAPPG